MSIWRAAAFVVGKGELVRDVPQGFNSEQRIIMIISRIHVDINLIVLEKVLLQHSPFNFETFERNTSCNLRVAASPVTWPTRTFLGYYLPKNWAIYILYFVLKVN